jgi:hypothetical protein
MEEAEAGPAPDEQIHQYTYNFPNLFPSQSHPKSTKSLTCETPLSLTC